MTSSRAMKNPDRRSTAGHLLSLPRCSHLYSASCRCLHTNASSSWPSRTSRPCRSRPARTGAPLTVPIWYQYVPGGEVWVLTLAGSRKARHIEAAGRFSLMVDRLEPTIRYVSVDTNDSRDRRAAVGNHSALSTTGEGSGLHRVRQDRARRAGRDLPVAAAMAFGRSRTELNFAA